jgi:hypothetical protein
MFRSWFSEVTIGCIPRWNGTAWAPDAPCQPDIVAQEKGPYPGIWLGERCSCCHIHASLLASLLVESHSCSLPD